MDCLMTTPRANAFPVQAAARNYAPNGNDTSAARFPVHMSIKLCDYCIIDSGNTTHGAVAARSACWRNFQQRPRSWPGPA